jgi:predicted TIM-barrel fold metal-dependent hydrolase
MNWRRLMWANDFPHPDASWPNSKALLEKQTAFLTAPQRKAILCDNAAALYGFDPVRLTALAA